jgi:hypothetical protein
MRAKKLFPATADLSNTDRHINSMLELGARSPLIVPLVMGHWVYTKHVPTLATDGRWMYANPEFVMDGLTSDAQLATGWFHEGTHKLLMHMERTQQYKAAGQIVPGVPVDFRLANCAQDYVINAMAIRQGYEPIPNWLFDPEFTADMSFESVYVTLWNRKQDEPEPEPEPESDQDQPGQPGGEGQSGTQSSDQSDPTDADADADDAGDDAGDDATDDKSGAGDGDEISDQDATPEDGHDGHLEPQYEGDEDQQEADRTADNEEVERQVRRGIEFAESKGQKPGDAGSDVRTAMHRYTHGEPSQMDWTEVFADFHVRSGSGGKRSRARFNRRALSNFGVLAPISLGEIGHWVDINDVSPSIRSDSQNAYLREKASLIDALEPRDGVTVLWTAASVMQEDEVQTGGDLLDIDVPRGSGTYMSAGLDYIDQQGLDPDLITVFTDGELYDSDWERLSERDNLVVVLDRQPGHYVEQDLKKYNIEYVVAEG